MKQKLLNIANGALGDNNYWQIRALINSEGALTSSHIDCYHYKKDSKITVENRRYKAAIGGAGMCLSCGELDLRALQTHHVFGKKYDPFVITLCANCHQILHWERGRKW